MLLQYWYLVEVSTEKQCANECYSSAKQSAPSPHLTKTLLVVSAAAVFSWLPHAIILNMTAAHMVSVPIIIFHCFYILTYSSSFVNPQCSRRRAVDRMDKIRLIHLIEPRTLQTDPSYTERNFEHESMDTKVIVITQNCKKSLPLPTHNYIRCN